MSGEIVGWVQRRHERKRTLDRISLGFVVDVVEDQPVQSQRTKTSDSHVGDLLCSFTIRRETRRGQRKEQELALAGINAADQVHGRDAIARLDRRDPPPCGRCSGRPGGKLLRRCINPRVQLVRKEHSNHPRDHRDRDKRWVWALQCPVCGQQRAHVVASHATRTFPLREVRRSGATAELGSRAAVCRDRPDYGLRQRPAWRFFTTS